METILVVDGYTYHLISYAYVTVSNKDYIGQHKSPSLKFAGEIKEIPDDHEWLTPLTAIERAPLGDTFLMEGVEGEAAITRADLEKELEEEKWLESRRVKPGWQQTY
jgi:hypothetical protein